ncbi:TetR/AcrR family transcriptional regulator [Fructilactobacillus myrtifloralis]|uniref:TetR/AcrR family transcriptional regulator n=1 Tax=Fructilactobacillus myrtifloralis TaxID=2940301 RepID=A0ABY5BQE3_9LACO|nr:TetR family transcriptional regulator [Fructilactobacillus myrtifloralis]USS85480.1 TetR/AcrR family transcriptional regulator [Fructilactobacillus myrtifloralis]
MATDRRILKTQAAIAASFKHLLETNDLEHITIKMICDEANIGRKTFYLHFSDKYELMDQFLNHYLEELFAACQDLEMNNVEAKARIWVNFFQENQVFFSSLFQSSASYLFRKKFYEFTRKSLMDKDLKLDPTEVDFIDYGIDGLMEEVVVENKFADLPQLAHKIAEILLKFY